MMSWNTTLSLFFSRGTQYVCIYMYIYIYIYSNLSKQALFVGKSSEILIMEFSTTFVDTKMTFGPQDEMFCHIWVAY